MYPLECGVSARLPSGRLRKAGFDGVCTRANILCKTHLHKGQITHENEQHFSADAKCDQG